MCTVVLRRLSTSLPISANLRERPLLCRNGRHTRRFVQCRQGFLSATSRTVQYRGAGKTEELLGRTRRLLQLLVDRVDVRPAMLKYGNGARA